MNTTIVGDLSGDMNANIVDMATLTAPGIGATGGVQTHTITNIYNAADWQMSTTNDGLLTRYGYDAAGQQRSHTIVDGTTPVTSTLDAAGRTTSIAEGLGGSGPYTSTYGYNRNDLPISATMPGAVQEQVGYDSNSRLISVTATGPNTGSGATTLNSAYAYGYDALSRYGTYGDYSFWTRATPIS